MARIAIVPQPSRWPARNPDFDEVVHATSVTEASTPGNNVLAAPGQTLVGVAPRQQPDIRTGGDEEDPPAISRDRPAMQRCSSAIWSMLCGPSTEPIVRLSDSVDGAAVHYPIRFKALGAAVIILALTWIMNYVFTVLPAIDDHQDSPCKFNDNQLSHNAKMLFVYFVWFTVARILLFIPCIATRVALVQARTHGFCRTYLVHLVLRDGPLYIFVMGSLLFWFHLMQAPDCPAKSPKLYRALNLYAIYSCMLSMFCLVLAYWHNKLLVDAMREIYERAEAAEGGAMTHPAPPNTAASFKTQKYDPAIFGDDKRYPPECPICLVVWDVDEVVRITPCDHAFHEECVSNWLQTSRVCPICRQDITPDGGARRLARDGDASLPAPQTLGAQSSDSMPERSSHHSLSSVSTVSSDVVAVERNLSRSSNCSSCVSSSSTCVVSITQTPSDAAASAAAEPRVSEP